MIILGIIMLIVGALGLGAIGYSKLSTVTLIDPDTIRGAHESRLKRDLLWDRIARRFARAGTRAYAIARPWSITAVESIHDTIDRLKKMEEKYVKERAHPKSVTRSEARRAAEEKFALAEHFASEEDWKQAEDAYVDAIKLDKKLVAAYEGLADLYVRTKELEKAEEMYKFLLRMHTHEGKAHAGLGKIAATRGKLRTAESEYLRALARHALAGNYIDLGKVYMMMGEPRQAIPQIESALHLEPNNPKFLDFFLEASILSGRRVLAWKAYERLGKANPEHGKLGELEKRIREM